METVNFTSMAQGTRAEYELLDRYETEFTDSLAHRILEQLKRLDDSISGYKVSRLEHCLQSATRAHRAGEPEEVVVAALVHDIGDMVAPFSHSELAAAVLRPFVSEKIYWIVKHHGLFQMYYFAHHLGGDRNARDRYRDHQWYDDAIRFCELYDQNCFDPDYDSEPLAFFAPMVERLFRRENIHDFETDIRYGDRAVA
ncbi:MAG TPA: HD domain-containing protein [Gammaproteobacteria bacterium]|nr:HD domain-containing protein [Gammaproteobacteria bacterium]HIM04081.1 HD domain-containing protein [Gammaproteobacteria bacterium]